MKSFLFFAMGVFVGVVFQEQLLSIFFLNVSAQEKKETKEIVDSMNDRLAEQAKEVDTKTNQFIIEKSNYEYAKKRLQALTVN